MKSRLLMILSIALMVLTLVPTRHAMATDGAGVQPPVQPGQFENPPSWPDRSAPPGAVPGAGGHGWVIQTSTETSSGPGLLAASGGPDEYGYTWSNSGAFDWIDARSGTDTGLGTEYGWNYSINGKYDFGFDFHFYGRIYNGLYISTAGVVGFDWGQLAGSGTPDMPSPSQPDNFIAPYLAPLVANKGAYTGKIYYKSGGTAPNRYSVVEWYQVQDEYGGKYTFETILRENGDIEFSYQSMVQGSNTYCMTASGIENEDGSVGLPYLNSGCNSMAGSTGKTIRFTHPAPQAYMLVTIPIRGSFTFPKGSTQFSIRIDNLGDLGADTFNLSTAATWTVKYYHADGTTLLTDTDGDGKPDTGSVPSRGSASIKIEVVTPASAVLGNQHVAVVTISSHLNPARTKVSRLTTAVPAPFTQTYTDNYINSPLLDIVHPSGQAIKRASSESVYGSSPAVIELNDHNIMTAWMVTSCRDPECTTVIGEIYYSVMSPTGGTIRGVSKLIDRSGSTGTTFDAIPALAVSPDGRVAVSWLNYAYQGTGLFNSNIMLMILSPDGDRISGPINITQNTLWGDWYQYYVPSYYSSTIASTGDNHFVLAWESYKETPTGSIDDIYYSSFSSAGAMTKPVTKLTNDTPDYSEGYYGPNLASLQGNRVLLAWDNYAGNHDAIVYVVMDSSGKLYQRPTVASGTLENWKVDAVQLSSGRIVVAMMGMGNPYTQVSYSLVDGSTYAVIKGPTILNNPEQAKEGALYPSVTADQAGHGIITWQSGDRESLVYALVDGSGGLTTAPMSFNIHVEQYGNPSVGINSFGYGNTAYSYQPSVNVDARLSEPPVVAGPPGGKSFLPIHYENIGTKVGTNVTLTLTLGAGLTYLSDNSGYPAVVAGNTVTWTLPDLAYLESGEFTVTLGLPADPIGTTHPISLVLATAGPEQNPADNTASLTALTALQSYLPVIEAAIR